MCNLQLYQKQESSSSSGYESEYSSTSTCKRDHRNSSSECSNSSDSEMSTASTIPLGSEVESTLTEDGLTVTRTANKEDDTVSISITATSAWASSTRQQPEYKQILHNLFNIFNNSKRKYPIPMYPFIQEARRQTSGLTFTNTTTDQ